MSYLPQYTFQYKTYLKRAIAGSIGDVFKAHPDPLLRKTNVTIEFPKKKTDYPSVVVRFFERVISNAGIGHYEYLYYPGEGHFKAKHYLYNGDLEFSVYALSSLDRDIVSDSLVNTVTMGDLEAYSNQFLTRVYPKVSGPKDYSQYHYINIKTDNVQGFGETQTKVPWGAEDDLLYQSSYRVACSGELYNRPLDKPTPFVEHVRQYPYIAGVDPLPDPNPTNPNPWLPEVRDEDDGFEPQTEVNVPGKE